MYTRPSPTRQPDIHRQLLRPLPLARGTDPTAKAHTRRILRPVIDIPIYLCRVGQKPPVD